MLNQLIPCMHTCSFLTAVCMWKRLCELIYIIHLSLTYSLYLTTVLFSLLSNIMHIKFQGRLNFYQPLASYKAEIAAGRQHCFGIPGGLNVTGPRVTFSVSAYWLIRGDHVTEIHQTCVPVKGSAPGLTIASFTFFGSSHTFFFLSRQRWATYLWISGSMGIVERLDW